LLLAGQGIQDRGHRIGEVHSRSGKGERILLREHGSVLDVVIGLGDHIVDGLEFGLEIWRNASIESSLEALHGIGGGLNVGDYAGTTTLTLFDGRREREAGKGQD
jgi:hypothetical protein